ncbi:MAG: SRPBCC family protein [Gammaproteobacteria bacterium]|jgi:effector-binding domain-containing protein
MRILKWGLAALALLAVLVCGIGLALPRHVHVERSIDIRAPRATVFTLANGMRNFNRWSPWAARDPNATIDYRGPEFGKGSSMHWHSDDPDVGSGTRTIIDSQANAEVRSHVTFAGRDDATTTVRVSAADGGITHAVWSFDTDLGLNPFARYSGLFLDSAVGPDYAEGLQRLKTLTENLPRADFEGLDVQVVKTPTMHLAYAVIQASMDDATIAARMDRAVTHIKAFVTLHGLKPTGPPVAVVRVANRQENLFMFDAAVPVNRGDVAFDDSTVRVETLPGGRAVRATRNGPYDALPDTLSRLHAWLAAHGWQRRGDAWQSTVDPGRHGTWVYQLIDDASS